MIGMFDLEYFHLRVLVDKVLRGDWATDLVNAQHNIYTRNKVQSTWQNFCYLNNIPFQLAMFYFYSTADFEVNRQPRVQIPSEYRSTAVPH